MSGEVQRCAWVSADPACVRYHDEEWGVPLHDDRGLFEHLVLQGAQAGLSWMTILRKREHYRRAFAGFDPRVVARFGDRELHGMMGDAGLVRNRRKLESAIDNARVFLDVQARHGSFDAFIWAFTGGQPVCKRWSSSAEIPVATDISRAMNRELKRLGFRFVGPTMCYAFMQAVGIVNDHTVDCFRLASAGKRRGGSACDEER